MDKPDKDGDKESIEEILSDLNSLLNRMPAILSDIKMPETQPVDFSKIRREVEDQVPPQAEPPHQDATIRLEPDEMAGIAASAHVLPDPDPEPAPEPEPDLSGEEYNFEFSPEPQPAAEPQPAPEPEPAQEPVADPAPENSGKAPDSFEHSGDFGVPDIDALLELSATGEDAIKPAEENKDQGGEMEEKDQNQEKPAEGNNEPQPAGETVPETDIPAEQQPAAEEPAPEQPAAEQPPVFDATVKMDSPFEVQEPSEAQQPPQEQPEPEQQPAAEEPAPEQPAAEQPPVFDATVKMDSPFEVQEPSEAQEPPQEQPVAEPAESQPSGDDLKAFESAFVIPGTDNVQEPEAPAALTPDEPQPAPAPEAELQMPEGLSPEPAQQPAADAQDVPASGGISLEPQFPMPEEPAEQTPSEQTAEQPPVEEPQLTVGEPQLSVGEPQLSVGTPDQPAEGLSLEPRSDTPFESPIDTVTGAASSGEAAEEKTVVFGPGQMPETPGGEETLVYQGGDPSSTSRMKTEASLPELAALEPPASVDQSRIKTLAFLYAAGEEKFCADVLATLDAICLKSESRPMFIRRAFVKPCADDMRGAMAQQMVSDAGAAGLICVGNISQEALYDVENAFGSSGAFYRHFSPDSFSLSSALDSVLDLILKP